MLARALLTCSLIFLSLSSFATAQYLNYCKIYNPNKGIEYETHTKTTVDFCKYYLEICNKKYDNKCIAKMNGYQGLYNTNNGLATMHVLYNDDFDKPNN